MQKIIVLTGVTSGGKTTVASELAQALRMPVFSLSEFIRAQARARGFKRVADFSKAYKRSLTSYAITFPSLFTRIKRNASARGIIIEGVYDPILYNEIKQLFKGQRIYLVNISATRHVRKRRVTARKPVNQRDARKYLRSVDKIKSVLGINELLALSKREGLAIRPTRKNQSLSLIKKALRQRRRRR